MSQQFHNDLVGLADILGHANRQTTRRYTFLGLTVVCGLLLSRPIVRLIARTGHPEAMLVVGLGLCFILAFVAERVGLADIIGAFAAGLLLDPHGTGIQTQEEAATLAELLHPLSSLFVPLCFVLMGLQVYLGSLTQPRVVGFGGLLLGCAITGKLACALEVLVTALITPIGLRWIFQLNRTQGLEVS